MDFKLTPRALSVPHTDESLENAEIASTLLDNDTGKSRLDNLRSEAQSEHAVASAVDSFGQLVPRGNQVVSGQLKLFDPFANYSQWTNHTMELHLAANPKPATAGLSNQPEPTVLLRGPLEIRLGALDAQLGGGFDQDGRLAPFTVARARSGPFTAEDIRVSEVKLLGLPFDFSVARDVTLYERHSASGKSSSFTISPDIRFRGLIGSADVICRPKVRLGDIDIGRHCVETSVSNLIDMSLGIGIGYTRSGPRGQSISILGRFESSLSGDASFAFLMRAAIR